jgi:hypothetical protein
VVLLNGRDDRPLRSVRFGEVVGREITPERLLLTGGGWRFARRAARRVGYPEERMVRLVGRTADELLERLTRHLPCNATLLGLGNYQGVGRMIVEHAERTQHVC